MAKKTSQAAPAKGGPLKVDYVALDSLTPFARNARQHFESQIEQIAASMREFGWTNPILVDATNTIIAGHCRALAAQRLGMKRVPAITLVGLTATQRRALVIADNRLNLSSGWDDDMLRLELGELQEVGFDLELTGFTTGELDDLFAPAGSANPKVPASRENRCPTCGRFADPKKLKAKPKAS